MTARKGRVGKTRPFLHVYGQTQAMAPPRNVIPLPPYEIDETGRAAREAGAEIELTTREFDLLLLFAKHVGQAFSRESILRQVWGEDYFGSDRVVDDLVRRLRKKMPELRIETLYGFGYRMVER